MWECFKIILEEMLNLGGLHASLDYKSVQRVADFQISYSML